MKTPVELLSENEWRSLWTIEVTKFVGKIPFMVQFVYLRKYTDTYSLNIYAVKELTNKLMNKIEPLKNELKPVLDKHLPIDELDIEIVANLKAKYSNIWVDVSEITLDCDKDKVNNLKSFKRNTCELRIRPKITLENCKVYKTDFCTNINIDVIAFIEDDMAVFSNSILETVFDMTDESHLQWLQSIKSCSNYIESIEDYK